MRGRFALRLTSPSPPYQLPQRRPELRNRAVMLAYIHVIVEFMSQPEYEDLIPMFGIVNEACLAGTRRAHLLVHRPPPSRFTSIHDGSPGTTWWMGLPPARTASSSTRIHILRLTALRTTRRLRRAQTPLRPAGYGRSRRAARGGRR
ncbi:hypothetical protein B0H14DRAFT_463696 [Mycena olivaceomarginata]|nr:hypothetical protein B0H14DRAFT_463696 [Mycena olivaceomarginata]